MNLNLRKAFLETAIKVKEYSNAKKKEKLQKIIVIEGELRIATHLFENIAAKKSIPSSILLRVQRKIEDLWNKTNKIKKSIS